MKKSPADPFKNPVATLNKLAKQNPGMDLDIDYAHLLSPSELEFMVKFTLEQVGDRKTCERQANETIRKENTRLRGHLRQSDAMSRTVDVVRGDLSMLQVAAPEPSPELQAMYNQLEARGELVVDREPRRNRKK